MANDPNVRTTEGRGRLYSGVIETMGNTSCIEVKNIAPTSVRLYVKVEFFNPAASVKDRLAVNIIEAAERSSALKPGQTVVEAIMATPASALPWSVRRRAIRWSSPWPTASPSNAAS